MLSFARCSILKELSVVVCALVVLPSLAWTQRPLVPAAHPHVAPVHVSTPPAFHEPVIQTPIMQAPAMYAPIAAPPRHPIFLPAGTPGVAGCSYCSPCHPPDSPGPAVGLRLHSAVRFGRAVLAIQSLLVVDLRSVLSLDIWLHHCCFPGPHKLRFSGVRNSGVFFASDFHQSPREKFSHLPKIDLKCFS